MEGQTFFMGITERVKEDQHILQGRALSRAMLRMAMPKGDAKAGDADRRKRRKTSSSSSSRLASRSSRCARRRTGILQGKAVSVKVDVYSKLAVVTKLLLTRKPGVG